MNEQLREMIARGHKLARVDETDYLAIELVFAWPPEGEPTAYCVRADWPATWPAKVAERDLQLTELEAVLSRQADESLKQFQRAEAAEARIAELERLIEELPIPPAVAMAATGMPLDADPGPCPECDRSGWKNQKALNAHRKRAHGDQAGWSTKPKGDPPEPPPPAATIRLLPDDPSWRCVACGSGSAGPFARSLHDPDRCIRCAQLTNGHLVAA